MNFDPLEIFKGESMPDTYLALCKLDVQKRLLQDFGPKMNAKDIVDLHRASKLDDSSRGNAVKDVISNITSRNQFVGGSNNASAQVKRIKL